MNLAPCFYGLGPLTIKLLSYSRELPLECAQRFSTLCLKYGPTMHSSSLGSSFLIFIVNFFEVAFQLEYIMAFLSRPMDLSSFWVLACNKEAQDQGDSYCLCRMLDARSIVYLLPQVQCSPFQEAIDFGLMIATRLWFYEPSKLRYTFRLLGKPLICENFFSFHPNILGHAINFVSSFQIFTSFICPLELGEHKIYG